MRSRIFYRVVKHYGIGLRTENSTEGSFGVLRSRFGKTNATKNFSVKKRDFQRQGGWHSVNQGFGQDFYRTDLQDRQSSEELRAIQ